jgi:hypothetical protein
MAVDYHLAVQGAAQKAGEQPGLTSGHFVVIPYVVYQQFEEKGGGKKLQLFFILLQGCPDGRGLFCQVQG